MGCRCDAARVINRTIFRVPASVTEAPRFLRLESKGHHRFSERSPRLTD